MEKLAMIDRVVKVQPIKNKKELICINLEKTYGDFVASVGTNVGDKVIRIISSAILPEDYLWWSGLVQAGFDKENRVIRMKPFGRADDGVPIMSRGAIITQDEIKKYYTGRFTVGKDLTKKLKIKKHYPDYNKSIIPDEVKPWWVRINDRIPLLESFNKNYYSYMYDFIGDFGFPSTFAKPLKDIEALAQRPSLLKKEDERVYVLGDMHGLAATAFLNPNDISRMILSTDSKVIGIHSDTIWANVARQIQLQDKLTKLTERTGKLYIVQFIIQNLIRMESKEEAPKCILYTLRELDLETMQSRQMSYLEMLSLARDFNMEAAPVVAQDVDLGSIMPNEVEAYDYMTKHIAYKIENDRIKLLDNPEGEEFKDYGLLRGIIVRSLNRDALNNIGFEFTIKNETYSVKEE